MAFGLFLGAGFLGASRTVAEGKEDILFFSPSLTPVFVPKLPSSYPPVQSKAGVANPEAGRLRQNRTHAYTQPFVAVRTEHTRQEQERLRLDSEATKADRPGGGKAS